VESCKLRYFNSFEFFNHTTLDKQGLNVGYHVFRMSPWRARRGKAGTAPGGWEKIPSPRGLAAPTYGMCRLWKLAIRLLTSNDWKPTDLGFIGAQRREGLPRQEERRNQRTKSND